MVKSDYTPSEIVKKVSELTGEGEQAEPVSEEKSQHSKEDGLGGFKSRKI